MKIKNFISYFNNIGINIISYKSIDSKFVDFCDYLDYDLIIGEINSPYKGNKLSFHILNEDDIINILNKEKNKKILITTRLSLWNLCITTKKVSNVSSNIGIAIHLKNLFQKIRSISILNNLSISITNEIYNNSITTSYGGRGIQHVSDFIVFYQDDIFNIIKNKYGINENININDMNFLFTRKIRRKKLKRILD